MSDNPFRITVTFKDEASAQKVEEILRGASTWIREGFEDENCNEERYIGQYITNLNETEGVQFTSYWVPNEITLDGNVLTYEFVGSPGDDWPDDIIVWFGKRNAESAKGTLLIDQTGDVVEVDESF